MLHFSELFTAIDQTTSTNEKIDALVTYFGKAPANDVIWCVALLSGRRPKRTVKRQEIWQWSSEISGLPHWLLDETYHIVGDLAETISLVLPEYPYSATTTLYEIMRSLIALEQENEDARKDFVTGMWLQLSRQELLVFNKLITGGFRMGVSDKIVIKALAKYYEIEENIVAHRLSGQWDPLTNNIADMLALQETVKDVSRPYPFYLAYPIESSPDQLGDVKQWMVERKYDGIRGQIIVRDGQLFIWSRGEDLMTSKFIEFQHLADLLPNGTVIDGEILPIIDSMIQPFHVMQTRIGRKNVTKKALAEAPLQMICYDLLENHAIDIRHLSLLERRTLLETVVNTVKVTDPLAPIQLSPLIACDSWDAVAQARRQSREYHCEGLMLKRINSAYKTGRKRGDWWKWKVNPLSIDGVLLYAQRGHGRRANLYTDFTFAVWDGDSLVPFAKAYSGLTDKELVEVDSWIKKHTIEKFGPVRSVTPELVFEIGFEGINPSPRHKSGIALRFPRILRWRLDKTIKEADTLTQLQAFLKAAP